MLRFAAAVFMALLPTVPLALAASGDMSMPMGGPQAGVPTMQAWTADHRFLVKLLSVPRPIPFEKYFTVRFAVFDARDLSKPLRDAKLQIDVGMRHGMAHGFAHGMQSAPKIVAQNGAIAVSGLYFHMMGPWTLKATVEAEGGRATAYFDLPCCGR
jgi:hypothetical protein